MIDWAVVAAWAQFGAILATGGAAVFVANRQLAAYNLALIDSNKNQRFSNSIKALDDMRSPMKFLGFDLSPLEAGIRSQRVADDPAQLERYKRLLRAAAGGIVIGVDDEQWFREVHASVSIAANYYLDFVELVRNNLVDYGYVMSKMSAFLPPAYDAIVALSGSAIGTGAFRDLAEAARAQARARGATRS